MFTAAEGRRIRIRGIVQGVGFRPWVYRVARSAGVGGRVRNDAAGVTIEAFGDRASLTTFEEALHLSPPPAARIVEYAAVPIPAESLEAFEIEPSEATGEHHVSIPPDLATCDECVRDIFDPADRRFRYAFTNCTNCGPRFTIATDAPYDRSATTMAPFTMCEACRREYGDVVDRRFHAQPVACPTCGPRLWLVARDADVNTETADPIAEVCRALARGRIAAIKGIGGFHLACDATSDVAVRRLRVRKHRDEKPLAVMIPSLEAAERLAVLTPAHRALLQSSERPIVLAERRPSANLAASIAPHNRQVGLMLPYSPLHHLVMAGVNGPLVMTSGNLSEEPIAVTNEEAERRLGAIADLILQHDRDIHTRCDDSVVSLVAGAPMIVRRSRGFVPRAIDVGRSLDRPVLGTGALLKNTFCLAAGTQAFLGPHIGDLENLETYESFTAAIDRFQRFVDIRPELVACDAHPDYLSTMYALGRPEPVVRVQHHHAHVVAVMAEHRIEGPAIGIAYDGTGYGFDGTSWGGEILLATAADFERLVTFRPIALVGGDAAVREPWRAAVALVLDAFDGTLPEGFDRLLSSVGADERARMARLVLGDVRASRARGVGRYFDAFGALFLNRRRAVFEGQIALEWNQVASAGIDRSYPFDLDTTQAVVEVDLRPAVRVAVDEALRGVAVSEIAAAFHNTLAEATAAAVRRASTSVGRLPVVAGGGCFQNARLAESVCAALAGFDVRLPAQAPPGDGGIALGQVVVAAAVAGGR